MKLLLLSLLVFPFFVSAETNIKILSFVMNDHKSTTSTSAELCGQITDSRRRNSFEKVTITSDPGKNQGVYVANVGSNGIFCHVIRTITRTARVDEFTRNNRRPRAGASKIFTVTD